jgi:hypothetical protein
MRGIWERAPLWLTRRNVSITLVFVVFVWASVSSLITTRQSSQATRDASVAVADADLALERAASARHALCLAVRSILATDVRTIKAGPASTAKLLALLGFDKETIAAFTAAQQESVDREIAARPEVRCHRGVEYVPPQEPVQPR